MFGDDSPGTYFLTPSRDTDPGDSGGPLFDSAHRQLGILHGYIGDQDWYTNVPYYLEWILTQIGWTWDGTTSVGRKTGTLIDTFSATAVNVCQYACTNTAACVAYAYNASGDTCHLLSTVSGSTFLFGWSSGQK
jgi:secreted trypsin-like serine protease